MFIAHLPAGYLLTRGLQRFSPAVSMTPGLFGSVFPDVDLLWFYGPDHHQTLHHAFITHLPAFWLAMAGIAYLVFRRHRPAGTIGLVFVANALLHLVLDTVVGRIRWLAPLSDRWFAFAFVPSTHGHWLLNFLLHWSFAIEVAICAVAFVVWRRSASLPASAASGSARFQPSDAPRGSS